MQLEKVQTERTRNLDEKNGKQNRGERLKNMRANVNERYRIERDKKIEKDGSRE